MTEEQKVRLEDLESKVADLQQAVCWLQKEYREVLEIIDTNKQLEEQ